VRLDKWNEQLKEKFGVNFSPEKLQELKFNDIKVRRERRKLRREMIKSLRKRFLQDIIEVLDGKEILLPGKLLFGVMVLPLYRRKKNAHN
jgi:hypothetical protein